MLMFLFPSHRTSFFCLYLTPSFSPSESDVKQLWLQLKKDEPHLLSSFEDFLTRIFSQLQEAHEEKNELECALKKWVACLDSSLWLCVETRNIFSYVSPKTYCDPSYQYLPKWRQGPVAFTLCHFEALVTCIKH